MPRPTHNRVPDRGFLHGFIPSSLGALASLREIHFRIDARWPSRAGLVLAAALSAIAFGGCVGPPVLERQVLAYDEVTRRLDEKLLLLNLARVDHGRSIHFTSTSSIAATFDWTTAIGASGQLEESKGVNFLNLNLGATSSENPTFQIIPVAGEQFTKQVLTPFSEEIFEFLVFQGAEIDQVMRMMAAGIEVQDADGKFVRFIENDPAIPAEYEEFRRRALHLQWLNENRHLFVRPLVFTETLIDDFKGVPRAEDINNGFNLGLRWRQKPNGNYELSRLKAGRVVVMNADPMGMTDEQRFELNERIRENPKGFVYVDVRPGGPGGDFAFQGAIKLRSMYQILLFLARGIREQSEFEIAPDPRTGPAGPNPRSVLQINVTDGAPAGGAAYARYRGLYYTVNDTSWDRTSFHLLNLLFQTTVGHVESVGIPITISK
jgi:hypothetical protein